MTLKAAILVTVMTMVSGCLLDNGLGGQPRTSPEAAGQPSREAIENDEFPQLHRLFAGGNCQGFQSTFDAPAQWYADEVPEEWRNAGSMSRHYGFAAYYCERLGLPSLERGPATILFEFHGNANPPNACLGNSGGIMRFVRSIYVSDPGLSEGLNLTFGTQPVLVDASIDITDAASLQVASFKWTSRHGYSYVDTPRQSNESPSFAAAYVWLGLGDSGPWRVEMTGDFVTYPASAQVGAGEMSSETLHADLYGGAPWLGSSTTFARVDFSGQVARFDDMACARETP